MWPNVLFALTTTLDQSTRLLLWRQVPPPGPLRHFVEQYRIVMTAACLVMTFIVRYGVADAVAFLCRLFRVNGWNPPSPVNKQE